MVIGNAWHAAQPSGVDGVLRLRMNTQSSAGNVEVSADRFECESGVVGDAPGVEPQSQ